ncbi:MAG: RsmB/NOP family class I SAM-dependent RNA methyltransferase [Pseudomonadota bacterium]
MTPAARVQAAIDVLAEWQDADQGLDRVLAKWSLAHRFSGSKDRAAIADHVYGAVRRMRSAGWVSGSDDPTPRDILRGNLLLDGKDPAELFTGVSYAPSSLSESEQSRRPLDDAPRAVRLDYPDWIEPMMTDLPDQALDAMRDRAALDLRVNVLKTDVRAAGASLASDGVQTIPHHLAKQALRVTEGARKVTQSKAYETGLVEIQDAASQAVVELAATKPGETVLDLCAGGGGKTLALAAAMANTGRLMAYDISQRRLAQLAPRADRAGAKVTMLTPVRLKDQYGACDLVLVDAPCSGSGAWRRNPDAKWRLTPDALDELTRAQQSLLRQAANLTSENGRIAYITCSMFQVENTQVVEGFLQSQGRFRLAQSRHFTPLDGADGFYVAVLQDA